MDIRYLSTWEDELNVCIRCAYCFEGCPVFRDENMGWEVDGPRGKLILAHGLLTGEIEPSEHIADKIYSCSFCQDCVQRCSANVSVPDIMAAARTDLKNNGFTRESIEDLVNNVETSGNIFGEDLEINAAEGDTPVLVGCRFRQRPEDVGKYLDILRKLGISPRVVDDEICCGMPQGVLGYKDDFAEYKEKFKEKFPFRKFICLCTTCAYFISKAYPELEPVYVIDVIHEKLPKVTLKKLDIKVTYHDPCNVSRGMGMVDEPREIMDRIGTELVEMPTSGKQSECCGGGGGLLVTDNALASRLAGKRVHQAEELDVEYLTTLCPTCEFNLQNSVRSTGSDIEIKNLLNLIWEALQ